MLNYLVYGTLILLYIVVFFSMRNAYKVLEESIDQQEKGLNRELKLLTEKGKIMEILINSKLNKENYAITLEKIEKELFEKNNS